MQHGLPNTPTINNSISKERLNKAMHVRNKNLLIAKKKNLGGVGDARQRFSTKPESGHGAQIVELAQLGRGEALADDRQVFPMANAR